MTIKDGRTTCPLCGKRCQTTARLVGHLGRVHKQLVEVVA